MSTFREQVEAQAEEWAERHRAVGRHVSCATEQAWVEADACAAAQSLIGSAVLRPYAADPDLKRLRREAKDALIDLTIAHKGRFFLPYQLYYSRDQLQKSYPEIDDFFAAKRKYDPGEVFTNTFYRKYSS